ncbi:MAG: J domain-containing protein [Bacteroidota bacterium]|nr:J domain-containing protein [Bacteroidota bacterium]
MALPDHYKTLGIPPLATQEEIKKAYRNLALRFHPDKSPGTVERFRSIRAAYEVLSNPLGRREYDAERRAQHVYAPSYDFGKFTTPHGPKNPLVKPKASETPSLRGRKYMIKLLLKPMILIAVATLAVWFIVEPPKWFVKLGIFTQP